jgi:hypothetical protein
MSAVNLSVATDKVVAGKDAYVLTVTPTATNSTLDSIKVAFDATTFVPLSVNVMATGGGTVLDAHLTSVDYGTISGQKFRFTPPAGAKIVRGNLKAHLKKGGMHKGMGAEGMGPNGSAKLKAMMRSLTVAQAQAKVGFTLLSSPDLPFQGAYVVGAKSPGPFAILRYGQGFGTVVLAEGKLTDVQQKQVLDALNVVTKLGTSATIGSYSGTEVSTPLVNAFIWITSDGVFHVAAGPVTDLQTFVNGLK